MQTFRCSIVFKVILKGKGKTLKVVTVKLGLIFIKTIAFYFVFM